MLALPTRQRGKTTHAANVMRQALAGMLWSKQFSRPPHGDNGAGLGASHQTGWTGIIARLLHLFATMTPESLLEGGLKAYARAAAEAEEQPRVAGGR